MVYLFITCVHIWFGVVCSFPYDTPYRSLVFPKGISSDQSEADLSAILTLFLAEPYETHAASIEDGNPASQRPPRDIPVGRCPTIVVEYLHLQIAVILHSFCPFCPLIPVEKW